MRDFLLFEDDLVIENFDLVIGQGFPITAQRIEQNLRLWLGEWFLDTSAGVPWLRDILGGRPNASLISAILRSQVLSDPDVDEILALTVDYGGTNRQLDINWRARLVNGIEVGGEITL